MKYYILQKVIGLISGFITINHIKRVENNTIKIEFNDKKSLYFDMTKGNSLIYIKFEKDINKKIFHAPFDIVLQKKFNNTKIVDVYLKNDDKLVVIEVSSRSSYKEQRYKLQFEFTGKNTNLILLDENDIILEALRHIDEWTSTRVIKVGQKLKDLQKPDIEYKLEPIEDIENFLENIYKKKVDKELQNLKKQKINQLKKQIQKVEKLLNNLEDIESLKHKVEKLNLEATKIVEKLYTFQGYEKKMQIKRSNDLFRDAKKAKAKVNKQYLEELNLRQKQQFYQRLIISIENSSSIDEVEFYFPKKEKNQIKTKKAEPYQSFFIDGYKIMLGRDERENIYLLENSRASDFWFHLKDQVSSHVIVSNTKKNIPENIVEQAAKICAKFSSDSGGVFEVDYTQRRNVKIQNRANVLYNPYTTIRVKV
jgi:predicted ribosome quality control (RQC) complex YloA/Tae2 family protein